MSVEQIDERVVETMRRLRREAEDAEYEASTPAAGRWRERLTDTRDDETFNLAQRHRFGRVLDKPKVRSDLDDSRWLVWFALYLAAVVVALVVIWLVAA